MPIAIQHADMSRVASLFLKTFMNETDDIIIRQLKKQPRDVFYKKGFLKTFTKFTEKHLC